MTVAELIEILKTMPQELRVVSPYYDMGDCMFIKNVRVSKEETSPYTSETVVMLF